MVSEMIEKAVEIVKKMAEKKVPIEEIKKKLTDVGISESEIGEILKKAGVEETPAEAPKPEEAPAPGEAPTAPTDTPAEAPGETTAEAPSEPAPVEEVVAEPPPLQPEQDAIGGLKEELAEIKSVVNANRTLTKELLDTTREVLMRLEQLTAGKPAETESLAPEAETSSDSLVTESSEAEVQKMLMKDLEKKST